MLEGIDHVALGFKDFDERLSFFTDTMAMKLKRIGTHVRTGRRIAFLADPSGLKIELVETAEDGPSFLHLAYRVDDVEAEYNRLSAAGLRPKRGPHELAAAKATTALLEDGAGLEIQLVRYAPDSPDL
jgi:methylmalonyl-CoA/ethylmalonyl-CoA epimerase